MPASAPLPSARPNSDCQETVLRGVSGDAVYGAAFMSARRNGATLTEACAAGSRAFAIYSLTNEEN